MDILLEWLKPVQLIDGSKENLVYSVPRLDKIPEAPGVYVFARRFGDTACPLYIGQALKLRGRIKNQLQGNVRLMQGINKAKSGDRLLLLAKIVKKQGQQVERVLDTVERALIEHALSQGHDLLNKQGTNTLVDSIRSKGKKAWHTPFPRRMNRKKR